jgi:hypothetical protein
MPTFRLLAVMAAVLWAATQATQAWDESGHLKIAALAYEELSDAGRVAADTILTNHLNFPAWAIEYNDYQTRTPDDREVSLGFYVFIRAAVWPDEIRDYDRPETHAYWHFITYPLKSPLYAFCDELMPETNVVVGIETSMAMAADARNKSQTRAKYLAFLIHLIGDIHQPLNCGSLVNTRFAQPEGDQGGTRFYVKETASGPQQTLRSFWDELLGSERDPDRVKEYAAALRTEYPRAYFASDLDVKDLWTWSRVSRNNAIHQAYKKFSSVTPTEKEPLVLPPGYKAEATAAAREYAAFASYRLADAIEQLLGRNIISR